MALTRSARLRSRFFVIWQLLAAIPCSTAAAQPAAPSPAESPTLAADDTTPPIPPAERVVGTWQEAIDTAVANSTDMRASYDAVLQAQGQGRVALGALLPQVSLSDSVYHVTINSGSGVAVSPSGQVLSSATSDGNVLGITASQTLVNMQQIYALGTADVAVSAAQLSYEDLARTVTQGVANAILAVVTAERVAVLNRIGLRQSIDRLGLTVEKRRLGAATDVDVVRAQQDAASARATIVTGDEALRQAREALGLALGTPVAIGVAPTLSLNELQAETRRSCRPLATVDERADIRAARKNVEVAKRRVDETWWQFLPSLTASASGARIDDVSNPTTTLWNIQATLTIPIWDGGQRYGVLRTNQAKLDAAKQSRDAAVRQAAIQIAQAMRAVSVAEDRLRVSDEARELATKNDELTRLGYRTGQMTSLDLVTAAAARRNADVSYALTEFALVRARIGAILALADCH